MLNLAMLKNKLNEHTTSVKKIMQFFKNKNLITTDVAQQLSNRNAETVLTYTTVGLPKYSQ